LKLFVDDTKPVPYGFILANSADEAISLCEQHHFEQISLDFNLGFRKKTGLDFMKEFIKRGFYVSHINIHSDDLIGVRYIIEEINLAIIEGKLNKEMMITRISY